MSQIENVMWCIAYALGHNPRLAEIHRAKDELSAVKPEYVNKTIKSIKLLLPYMSDRETDLIIWQLCTCLLSAAAVTGICVPGVEFRWTGNTSPIATVVDSIWIGMAEKMKPGSSFMI